MHVVSQSVDVGQDTTKQRRRLPKKKWKQVPSFPSPMAPHSYIHGVPESRQVQGGLSVGKCRSDRGSRSDFMSSINTTTTINISIANDDMTTTDNDNDDKARRATHAGHDLDCQKTSDGGFPNEEAGTSQVVKSVPAHGLISMQSPNGPAWPVLPAFQQPASCTGNSACTPPRSQVYIEQHMPRPPVVVGVANPSDLSLHFPRRKGQGPKAKLADKIQEYGSSQPKLRDGTPAEFLNGMPSIFQIWILQIFRRTRSRWMTGLCRPGV